MIQQLALYHGPCTYKFVSRKIQIANIYSRLLIRHPRVMERLRHEVLSVLTDGEHPTRDLIRKMPYLALVVKESQHDLRPAGRLATC